MENFKLNVLNFKRIFCCSLETVAGPVNGFWGTAIEIHNHFCSCYSACKCTCYFIKLGINKNNTIKYV